MKKQRVVFSLGFTLIELLIVVAIIAILAAIAVPNFLEAQTRSKVSRAKADERSFATAVEAYSVDWNLPPPGLSAHDSGSNGLPGCVRRQVQGVYDLPNLLAQSYLTTPIAYLTGILHDPFETKGRIQKTVSQTKHFAFHYEDSWCPYNYLLSKGQKNHTAVRSYQNGYTWVIYSIGPSRQSNGTISEVLTGTVINPDKVNVSYDPTNGTVSVGWIIRTNKGQFTTPGT